MLGICASSRLSMISGENGWQLVHLAAWRCFVVQLADLSISCVLALDFSILIVGWYGAICADV